MEKNLFSYYLFNNLLPHCLQLHCSQCKKQYVYTMYMSLFLFLTFLLYCSFFTIIIVYYNITVLWLL